MSEITPVKPIQEYYGQKKPADEMPTALRNPIDSKIQGMVQLQIHNLAPCALLASATSPRVVMDLIPGIALPSYSRGRPNKAARKVYSSSKPMRKIKGAYQVPIGLGRCNLYPPLNAILQLLLFLPSFRDAFSFAPRSYQQMVEFIDQYSTDQEKKLRISLADSNLLLPLLQQKMKESIFQAQLDKVDVKEFLCSLVQQVFERTTPPLSGFLAFHPEWNISWDSRLPFSIAIDLPLRPPEFFVTVESNHSESCPIIPRQFFIQPERYCYDLDAFVEYRPDGESGQGDYITYLKAEGTWYQCDDDRISPLRSTQLNMPLNRCILLHYKRIWPK